MKNYYRILGIDIDAEYEEIRAAYRILAQQHHPDKGGLHREFTLIQEAYTILSDPKVKRKYDKDLLRSIQEHQLTLKKPASSFISWIWLAVASILAISGLFFAYWAYQQHVKNEELINTKAPIVKLSQTPALVDKKLTHQGSKSKASLVHKKNSSQTNINQNQDNQLSSYSGSFYLLNTGSFNNLSAAKKQQIQLTTLGFSSKIQKINANSEGDTSYNVFVGPFYNLDNANKNLELLNQKNIEATLEQVSNE